MSIVEALPKYRAPCNKMSPEVTHKHIKLSPRLEAAAALIGVVHTAADIGADHGFLSLSLLQRGACKRVIATDISAACLKRAAKSANESALCFEPDFRVGSGLLPLMPYEADAIAICGMGGELIIKILSAAKPKLMGAGKAVLQPMTKVEQLRRYLYNNCYKVVQDLVVEDAGRLYQVFSVEQGQDSLPIGWPNEFFMLGHAALFDPGFLALADRLQRGLEKRLKSAKGTEGEPKLKAKLNCIRQVLALRAGAK